jgi:predicted amidohydrolase YtcJ
MGTMTLAGARLPGRDGVWDVVIRDGVVVGGVVAGGGDLAPPVLDVAGRWVLPAFWDEHVHFGLWAEHSRRVDASGATSWAALAELVAESVRAGGRAGGSASASASAPADPLVLAGFRDALWPDAPSRAVIDAASAGREVVAIAADLHCGWLSGAALRRAGRPDHPTGLLREEEWFAIVGALGDVPRATRDAWAAEAAAGAAARGVVGIVDLEMGWNLEDWTRRRAAGLDLLRVECGFYTADLDRAIAAGLRTGDPVDGAPEIRVGPFKVIFDGSLNTRTAWCFDPYPGVDGPDAWGLPALAPAELVALARRAAAHGLTPAIHAIGDRAVATALDAFDAIGGGGRIEHAQMARAEDLPRFARLGVIASVQPEHAMDDRDVADTHWAGRTERAFPLASLLAAGATLAFGSDAPVAPLDPWAGVAAAVGRTRDGRAPWRPEQAVGVRDALAASARGRRAVEVGMVADLQVVERDPLSADPEALRTMPVAATLLAGRLTHGPAW